MMNQRGFIAFSIIILLSTVLVAVVTTSVVIAVGEAQTSLTHAQGEKEWSLVDGCAEDFLQKIHDETTYSGTIVITRPEGTCTITIISTDPDWEFMVTAVQAAFPNSSVRTVTIHVTRDNALSSITWKEL